MAMGDTADAGEDGDIAVADSTDAGKSVAIAVDDSPHARKDGDIAVGASADGGNGDGISRADAGKNGGNRDRTLPRVPVPAARPFLQILRSNLMETFFPDDPCRTVGREKSARRRAVATLSQVFPFLEWAPTYTPGTLKSDLIAGITIASLAIPQGISYAKLANLPPVLGLYSSFVPPLVYAFMGSSKDLAIGTTAVLSILLASMLGEEVSATENPTLYLHLTFTSTLFAGIFQASLGIFRLGFIVDFLSHAAIVGFMGGAATVVCLQQLKEMLGLKYFTNSTDLVAVMRSIFSQTHQWRWETILFGCSVLFFLLLTRFISKRSPKLFWISAAAPLTSLILGSLLVYLTDAEQHGIKVIGYLTKGLNPSSVKSLNFSSSYLMLSMRTGIITSIIALAEGIAAGRSFAMFKNYHIDGNKEMIAIGIMNILGSVTSCYLTTGPFSRSAVNFSAGCKTAMTNVIMSFAVMITLLVLTPLFYYTPLVVLSAIIMSAMLGLIDIPAAIHLLHVDKVDFCVCIGAYLGVVFDSIGTGLVVAVTISILRVLLFVARPRTMVLGKMPNSTIYRRVDQYSMAQTVPGVLVIRVDSPIYFTNASYLRERILRWIEEQEDRAKDKGEVGVHYVVLDMGAVGCIDTSGTSMLDELRKILDRRDLQIVLANPGSEIMKKLESSKVLQSIGHKWIFPTVDEAVDDCGYLMHSHKPGMAMDGRVAHKNMV